MLPRSVLHSPDFNVLHDEVFIGGKRSVAEGGAGKAGAVVQVSIQPESKASPIKKRERENVYKIRN